MKHDITFCSNQKCRLKRCKRHLSNAPKNSEISMAELEGTEYCVGMCRQNCGIGREYYE